MKVSVLLSQILILSTKKKSNSVKNNKKRSLWFSLSSLILIISYVTINSILLAKNNANIKFISLENQQSPANLWQILSSNYKEKQNNKEDLGHWLSAHIQKISSRNTINRSGVFSLNREEKRLNSFINSVVGSSIPNLSFGIYRDEIPVYQKSIGFNTNTSWSIASVTKTFTSVAVMQLVNKGLISLEDDIAEYFPSFHIALNPKENKIIRIKHLLSHTSGIPYRWSSSELFENPVRKQKFYIPIQIHPAGKKFMYSNSNYAILAGLIELVSGQTYPDYIRKNIFIPLKMKSTSIYNYSDGASGIRSTLTDLSNFANMLISGGKNKMGFVNGKKMIDIMITPPEHIKEALKKGKGYINYYGYGIRAAYVNGKLHSIFHTGIYDGCLSEIRLFPKENTYLIHISNPPYYRADHVAKYRDSASTLSYNYSRKLNKIFPNINTFQNTDRNIPVKKNIAVLKVSDHI